MSKEINMILDDEVTTATPADDTHTEEAAPATEGEATPATEEEAAA